MKYFDEYCRIGIFGEGFIFVKLRIFHKNITLAKSREIIYLFTDTGKSCQCRDF